MESTMSKHDYETTKQANELTAHALEHVCGGKPGVPPKSGVGSEVQHFTVRLTNANIASI
jgi:hypothetical protein